MMKTFALALTLIFAGGMAVTLVAYPDDTIRGAFNWMAADEDDGDDCDDCDNCAACDDKYFRHGRRRSGPREMGQ
jgi:hypothetical protein